MVSWLEELERREKVAREQITELREEIARLMARLEETETVISRLQITRETMTEILSAVEDTVPNDEDTPALTGSSPPAGPGRADGLPIGVQLVPRWQTGIEPRVLPPAHRGIVEVLADAVHPLRVKHIAATLGLPPAISQGGPALPSSRPNTTELYGRGTADDKAGIAAHLAALRAYSGRPPIGVTVLVEGEEEVGSPKLSTFLDRHQDKLNADVILLADADNLITGTPCLTTGLRGITACVVELRALQRGVHSGIYGGAAPDALTALCRLLATLHDGQGNVAIEGLRTATAPADSISETGFRAEAGLVDGVHLLGRGSISERLWATPAATVLAIDATSVDAASNTLTPTARAKVGLRVAPGDDAVMARRALARHLRHHTPWGLHVTVTEGESGQPFLVDAQGPAFDAARKAYRQAYGKDVLDIGSGASISFIAAFAHAYPDAAILIASAGADGDSRAHSENESLHLADFERACLAETLPLTELRR